MQGSTDPSDPSLIFPPGTRYDSPVRAGRQSGDRWGVFGGLDTLSVIILLRGERTEVVVVVAVLPGVDMAESGQVDLRRCWVVDMCPDWSQPATTCPPLPLTSVRSQSSHSQHSPHQHERNSSRPGRPVRQPDRGQVLGDHQ